MKVVKFDEYFSKLKSKKFTTIRDHYKDIKLGSIVECRVVGETEADDIIFHARLEKIEIQTVWLIDDNVLAKDLDLEYNPDEYDYVSISEAMYVLNKYYHDLQADDDVFIYYFKRQ